MSPPNIRAYYISLERARPKLSKYVGRKNQSWSSFEKFKVKDKKQKTNENCPSTVFVNFRISLWSKLKETDQNM